jgi:ATP-dependent Clp protease ATP-binding subunit ClpA
MLMPLRPYVTARTHEVFAMAHDLADRLGHHDVTPMHVILAMIREGLNIPAQVLLFRRGVPRNVLEQELEAQLPTPRAPRLSASPRSWTPSDERMLEQATAEKLELGTEHVGCEHVLLAFLHDTTSVPSQVLARHAIGYDYLRSEVLRVYNAQPE